MRRSRRFPLFSALIALSVAAGVGYVSFADLDAPRRALGKVGQAVSSLGASLKLLSNSVAESGITFSDLASDEDPMPMLVNADHPVRSDYAPQNLVRMREYCDPNVLYIKGSEIDGDKTAVDALMVMVRAAIADGIGSWQISAGYRSVGYQQQLWDNKVYEYRKQGLSASQAQAATAKYVAKPGASEHHTGLAFDVTVPGESFPLTDQSKWLTEHCWEYGFIIRYTEEKASITGINAEPWHIRYVGRPHAALMRDQNLCLEEYLGSLD